MNVPAQKLQSQWGCRENCRHGATIERHSLSQPLRAASSLREGAGRGAYHSTGYSLNRGVAGDFHRPYETLMILDFTIQRNTREILRFIAYCSVRRADRAQMWAAASLGMCWRWDWRIWASWAGLSSRARAFSSSPRRRTAGTAMEVST